MTAISALTCDNKTDRQGVGSASTVLTHLSDLSRRGLGVSLPIDEEWRPVPGYEGLYEVSSHGRVRSVRTGRVLKPNTAHGYHFVGLYRDGEHKTCRIHTMVATAWHGPRQEGQVCRHLDGVKTHNFPENLRWGTVSENAIDAVAHGQHPHSRKDACPQGHPYTEENTVWQRRPDRKTDRAHRDCRECRRKRMAAYWDRHRERRNADRRKKGTCDLCGAVLQLYGMSRHRRQVHGLRARASALDPTTEETTR